MPKPRKRKGPDPLIGKTLGGRYLVKSLIDRGGMGKVYEAEQQPLGRLVALKTLDLLDPRGEFKERFFNEASIASQLTHPNTVRIFDYGRSDEGTYYLTMELLRGQSLQALVKRSAPLDASRLIHIVRQVCSALCEAHDKGVVHRDLKPGNIFLTSHGDDREFAKVLDFGLVKNLEAETNLSLTGQALGSPLYMSPEQVEGERVDARADIYSLGLVMYVALCGMVPFKKGSAATIMMQQVTARVPSFAEIAPDVEIHPSMEWIVRRCIEKDRIDRFASMRELSVALKLADQEIRGELPNPVPWSLDPTGNLDLPTELIGVGEETHTGGPESSLLEINDVPSSPTLNRSSTSIVVVTGGVAVGGMMIALIVAALTVLFGLLAWIAWQSWTPAQKALPPPPDPIVAPAPATAVRLVSNPPGAKIIRDGLVIGKTPLEVPVTEPPTVLTLQRQGYQTREITVDGSTPTLTVKLKEATIRPGVVPD